MGNERRVAPSWPAAEHDPRHGGTTRDVDRLPAPDMPDAPPRVGAGRPAGGQRMRRTMWWLVGLAVVVAGIGFVGLRIPAVQDLLLRRIVARRMAAAGSGLFAGDALRVLLCGTSSPLPHPTRAKPCVAVFAGDRFWVVDTGPGSWNRLALWQVDGRRIG